MYELRLYENALRGSVLRFWEDCFPESGRRFEPEGRHAGLTDIEHAYERFWCAADGGRVIGTVGIVRLSPDCCELKSLYLYRAYQGLGLGRRMLETAIGFARERGYRTICLDTLRSSEKALRLYRRAGFRETERYNRNPNAELFMALHLKETTASRPFREEQQEEKTMQYRKFGNTGETISALGFGCMRLPELEGADGSFTVDQEKTDAMLRRAYELGVNYFDTAYFYCHENSEIAVGKALAPIRDKVLISTKCPMENVRKPEDYRAMCEKSLKKLGTDHIDFYHFWSINKKVFDEKILGMNLLDEARKLKEEGLIRHISFSFHDDPSAIRHIIDNAPQMESMLVQYNLLDQANGDMIAYAASKGLGVVIMGPVGGGRLSAPAELAKKLTGKEFATYELALRFVLGNPNVSCALSGMQTYEMVEKNAAVASIETPMTEEEWREIGASIDNLKKFSELYCTGCGYCQPCPKGINIPRIFEAYTYHNVYGLSKAAKDAFNGYVNAPGKPGATSADCADCGYCERKCPQHLQVREQLKRVEKVLQGL